jgi:DNA-nicking Smr family endonuclease
MAGLGRALEAKRGSAPASEQADQPDPDEAAFGQAMAEVREIEDFRTLPVRPGPRPRLSAPAPVPEGDVPDAMAELEQLVTRKSRMNLRLTAEYAEWSAPGSPKGLAARLHAGEFAVQDYIDLHGFTLAEAEEELFEFIKRARSRALRCVKVIHGRGLRSPGGPVLRTAVRRWLQIPLGKHVEAYATARPEDGGLGALYALMRFM